jgi:Domain of unknown function (DUF5050)
MRKISLFFAHVFCLYHFGQLPETELWLIKLKKEKDSVFLGKATNFTPHKGYNNQPGFSLDERSVYFVRADSNHQTDIYNYDLRSGKTRRLTQTPVSEYSPQELQTGVLYAVVVETDSAQRIHEIETATGVHRKVLEPDSVGYYCFLNADTLIYYKLTEPHSLRALDLTSNSETWLGNAPGRGFKAFNAYTLYYCLKDSLTTSLYRYNFRLQKAELISVFPSGGEDIVWHSTLGLLRSEGKQILQLQGNSGAWKPLFDLGGLGLHRITRFALDTKRNYLVVVDNL